MSQKTYMYDTQWQALINAIDGGDTSAIATALGQIKTSVDGITTALGRLSTDVTQDSTQWTNLINAISSGGGGGGGTINIDATQWSNLLTEIAKGDMTATATALTNIYTRLNAIGFNSTQWNNLVNAITNQSLTVDLSNITSSVVSNLSNVLGSTLTDALNAVNSTLNDRDNFFVSNIKNFKDLQDNSSVTVDISLPDINIGIAYFVVCHCGAKNTGGYWAVRGLVSPHSRTDISIPIPQDWDNARIVSVPLNAINANTYNITFTNYTGVPTDPTYPSRVYAMVIKLK